MNKQRKLNRLYNRQATLTSKLMREKNEVRQQQIQDALDELADEISDLESLIASER